MNTLVEKVLYRFGFSKNQSVKARSGRVADAIVKKQMFRTRHDIQSWRNAMRTAEMILNPTREKITEIFEEIKLDALLSSQLENRKQATISTPLIVKNKNTGEINEDVTKLFESSALVRNLIKYSLNARIEGHELLEFNKINSGYTVTSIDKRYVDPVNKTVRYELMSSSRENYTQFKEYGSWIIELGEGDLGLLNKAVPHVLFKRFAQSCWSEFCEIYGIPPRVGKTNTQDKTALNYMQRMFEEQSSANWSIIDKEDELQFINAIQSDGSVFKNLITQCNSEISMLISGALIGQDTQHGTKGKEEVNHDLLKKLIESDKRVVESDFNSTIIQALVSIGFIPSGEYTVEFEPQEDLDELWTRTKDSMPYFAVDKEFLKEKFGIPVEDKQMNPAGQQSQQHNADYFFD